MGGSRGPHAFVEPAPQNVSLRELSHRARETASARLSADGGAGGNGANDAQGDSGGGGGGAGGFVDVNYRTSSTPGNIDAAHIHATGGAGGTNDGGSGFAGSAGEEGFVRIQQVGA